MTEPVQTILASSALTLLVSWGSVYLAHRFELIRAVRVSDREARFRLFATLMGQKLVLAQLYVSRFEALILSDYYEYRWYLAGRHENSIDFQETVRWMHKGEELVLEIARGNRELFEAVAAARTCFPESTDLNNYTEAVYRHKSPVLAVRANKDMTIAELEEWKTLATRQTQELVSKAVEKPIDDLVDYLAPRLRGD